MTAAEALAEAEAEGLALVRSSSSQSGFLNVCMNASRKVRPYQASVRRDGKQVFLGYFATAEEAALHVARTPEGANRVALPPPMTAAEALAEAEAEELALVRSSSGQSGFLNVSMDASSKVRPYKASVWRDGKLVSLGFFATAEEAALHVARMPEAQALVEVKAMAQLEAQAQAQAKTKAEAKAEAKLAAKADAARARQEQKLLFEQHRQQLEQQRQQMGVQQ